MGVTLSTSVYVVHNVGDILAKHKTQIDQTDKKISLMVSGENETELTLTENFADLISKNVNITGDRINLNGYVGFNNNVTIDQEGKLKAVSAELTNATITGGSINFSTSEKSTSKITLSGANGGWINSMSSLEYRLQNTQENFKSIFQAGGWYMFDGLDDSADIQRTVINRGSINLYNTSGTTTNYIGGGLSCIYDDNGITRTYIESSSLYLYNSSGILQTYLTSGILNLYDASGNAQTHFDVSTTGNSYIKNRLSVGTSGAVSDRILYVVGNASINGTLYTTSGTVSVSDRGLKDNITLLNIEKSANFIYSLKPSEFTYVDGESGRLHRGLIADEVKVSMGEDDWGLYIDQSLENKEIIYGKGLRYEELIADLIATAQYQKQQIEELKQKTEVN